MADEWYRIASLTTNGASLAAAAGVRDYTQMVVNISADISNAVSFALATPQQAGTATNVPTAWLTNWTESAVLAGSGDGMDLGAKYMLGLDPTSSNTYELSLENFGLVGSNAITGSHSARGYWQSCAGRDEWLSLAAGCGNAGRGVHQHCRDGFDGEYGIRRDGAGRRTYTNAVSGQGKFFKAIIQ